MQLDPVTNQKMTDLCLVLGKKGHSARVVAEKVRQEFPGHPFTRNSVIGRWNRNGFTPGLEHSSKIQRLNARKAAEREAFEKGLSQRPAKRTCQFIEGRPTRDDGCKCGESVKPNSPYCEAHHKRCHRPPGVKEP